MLLKEPGTLPMNPLSSITSLFPIFFNKMTGQRVAIASISSISQFSSSFKLIASFISRDKFFLIDFERVISW